jgi:hypothetical protein
MKRLIATALAAIALVGSIVFLATPAHADSGAFADTTHGAAADSVDITRVNVFHTRKHLAVRIHVRDLPRAWEGDRKYEVWIDIARTQKTPDFYMCACSLELYAGRTRGWDMIPGGLLPGTNIPDPYGGIPIRFSRSAAGDYIALRVPAKAIGHPQKVRVAVRTEKWNYGSADSTDHLGERRQFTPWVVR